MSYVNITKKVVNPCANYISNNWISNDWIRFRETNAFKKHFVARCAYVALAPLSLVTNFFDILIGMGFGIAAICTLGKIKRINTLTHDHIKQSTRIVADVYTYILLGINPQFKPEKVWVKIERSSKGFLSEKAEIPLIEKARCLSKSEKFVKKQVASRLLFASIIPVSIVTRALDGLISIPVIPLSLMTGGTRRFPSLHNLADRTAQAPGVLHTLVLCVLFTVNPKFVN